MGPVPLHILLLERKYLGRFYIELLQWSRKYKAFVDIENNAHDLSWHQYIRDKAIQPNHPVQAGDIDGLDGSIRKKLAEAVTT